MIKLVIKDVLDKGDGSAPEVDSRTFSGDTPESVAEALDEFVRGLAGKNQAPAQAPVRKAAIPPASFPGIKDVVFRLKTEEKVPVVKNGKQVQVQATDAKGNKMFTKAGEPVMKPLTEKKELANPVLTTIVFFEDGTSSTVKNSPHDPVRTETVKLQDGTSAKVATACSKEAGVVYALVKRAFGPVSENKATGGGFGKILTELVSKAHDQSLDEAKAKARKNAAKQKAKAEKAKAEKAKAEKTKAEPGTKAKPAGKAAHNPKKHTKK